MPLTARWPAAGPRLALGAEASRTEIQCESGSVPLAVIARLVKLIVAPLRLACVPVPVGTMLRPARLGRVTSC